MQMRQLGLVVLAITVAGLVGGCPQPAANEIAVTLSPSAIGVALGGSLQITAAVAGGDAPFTFGWGWDGAKEEAVAEGDTYTITPTPTTAFGRYQVTVTVRDRNGHLATTSTTIEVLGSGDSNSPQNSPVPVIVSTDLTPADRPCVVGEEVSLRICFRGNAGRIHVQWSDGTQDFRDVAAGSDCITFTHRCLAAVASGQIRIWVNDQNSDPRRVIIIIVVINPADPNEPNVPANSTPVLAIHHPEDGASYTRTRDPDGAWKTLVNFNLEVKGGTPPFVFKLKWPDEHLPREFSTSERTWSGSKVISLPGTGDLAAQVTDAAGKASKVVSRITVN